ncbi:hypothetical protein [Natrarchaeobaculum sulfurireducens]|uniref:Uncharacterized protein n=1 Tax=Natrarchaeobaculum sulfurireducens TaxID=2044521 RepID=A0A346PBY3_9EURY|nr:hypothetical protein [Natrarchaeobaculum sulfurireducens]AXR77028.1 hypothetical protein AArc1_0685 [Natrarchaeobaculum sulfurireducens]AXR83006.1 hypothetical protein AArcMg_3018 [Natrarchaeobaculum sulfurireducens]
MSPPPSVALVLLVLWVIVMFGATNVAGYHQWRTADPLETLGGPRTDDSSDDRSRTTRDAVAPPSDD